jgi:TonB-linked SusC/RagA family outer membrane protein
MINKQKSYAKDIFSLLLFCVCVLSVSAQQIKLKGTVSDNGMPLPGASVIIKGTANGTVTDFDGFYEINVNNDDVIVVSYVGYKSVEVAVNGKKVIDLQLIEDAAKLDEVVVIGYGTSKRKDLTGAISSVKAEEIDKVKTLSFEGALAGRMSGVQVVSSEGGPDAAFKIRIRGGTSINASNDPLYVVDGFPISGGGITTSTGLGNSTTSPLATMDPSNIESIDVLKDASATAIYGSRGANGVIIITTKKGKKGRTRLSFETFSSYSKLSNKLDVLTPQEFINYRNDFQPWSPELTSQKKYLAQTYRVPTVDSDGDGVLDTDYVAVSIDDPRLFIDDWQENITRSALTKNYRLSANGGSDTTNYLASFSYLNSEGIIKTSEIERYTLNLNITQKINERIRVGINSNIGFTSRAGVVTAATNNNQGRAGIVTSAALFSPVMPIRSSDPEIIDEEIAQGIEYDEDGRMIANQNGDISNPLLMLNENSNTGTTLQSRFNTFFEYKLSKYLTFKSSLRGFASNTKNKAYYSSRFGSARAVGGQAITNFRNTTSIVTEHNLNYRRTFGKHSVNANLVAEYQQNKSEYLRTRSSGFDIYGLNLDALETALETQPTVSDAVDSSLESYLARVQFNGFDNLLLLTASARYDGSSRFASGNKWGFFPSIGAAINLSRKNILFSNFFNVIKLRGSYGETGNTAIGSYLSLSRAGFSSYIFNGDDLQTGASIDRIPNPNLTWETTTQSDLGLSLSMYKNRINIEADYYNKITDDLLLNVPQPVTSGYETFFTNIGSVRNRGFEFAIDAALIESKDFTWNTNFNISFNKNKILDLGGAQEFFVTAIGGSQIQNDYVVRVGESLGAVYGLQDDGVYNYSDFVEFDGLTDAEAADLLYSNVSGTENWYSVNIYNLKEGVVRNSLVQDGTYRPGMTKFVDKNGDGIINDEDRHIIGNTLPVHVGGFSNNFNYKNFDLSVLTQWSYGNDIYNKNIKKGSNTANPWSNKLAIVNERWSPENPNNTLTSFNTGASGNFNSAAYSRFIEDGSYLRLSNITMGYKLPSKSAKSIGLKSLRIYAAIDNVFVWTKYSGWDPDVSVGRNQLTPGLDTDSYPRSRTFRLGINARL